MSNSSNHTYLTIMLCVTTMLLYADHNSLAPNLSAIAEEFNFSIAEKDKKLGGEIAVGFFIVGGLASVVIGFLADRLNRCKLFAFIVALGQVAGLMTYRARTYRELLVCRVLTGISIGGCNPLLYSILGDCYDSSQRVYVTTILGLAMSVGVGGGQLLAGFVGPTLGWRLPFLIIAVPALVLAAAVYFTAREPPRSGSRKPSKGGSDDKVEVGSLEAVDEGGSGGSPPISSPPSPTTVAAAGGGHESIEWSKVWELLSTKSVLIIYTQGIPGCIPWSIITVFLSDYLSSDKGLSVQLATFCMMTFGVGALFGQIFGGWAGQQLYNRDKRLQCIFMGSAAALGTFPFIYVLTSEFEGPAAAMMRPSFLAALMMTGFVSAIAGPNIRSVLQNVTYPESRGTAFALFTLADDLGRGGGPMLVAILVRIFGDRKPAFCLGALCWLFCGIALMFMSVTVAVDEANVQARVKKSVE